MKALLLSALFVAFATTAHAGRRDVSPPPVCPMYTTADIKPFREAVASCDTYYVRRNGEIRRVPRRIRNQYVHANTTPCRG
jgi:hypothetical protein